MRVYAKQLEKAYDLASGIFYPGVVDEERALAKDYDGEKSNQAIILYNEELNKVLRLPYFMRLKPEYVSAIKRKVWGGIYPQVKRYRDFLFVTFDASTSKYYSQSDAHFKIQKEWNSLLTRIRKKFPWVGIIRSQEWQENGIGCHLHVLFCGLRFLPKKWIKRTWDKLEKAGWSIEFRRVFDDPKRAVGYIMKYITKTLRVGDELPLSLVVNWALGVRTFACSRRFSSKKTNSNKNWVLLGFMPWNLAESYTDKEILGYFSPERMVWGTSGSEYG